MEHTIGFPNLGLEFTLSRVACTVLGKDIYWYGIIICAGFILAALYVNSRTKDFGITSDNLTDCLIICVPLGIICARIYYVVFEWGYYAQHPGEIIAIWKGGIAIYGGIIGTLIGLFVYSRVKKLSLASLCDLAAFGLLIGQCIGRWGNFVNGEAHGGPTTLPWGMTIDGQSMVHPTFLYESLWNLIGFVLLHFYSKKRRFKGEIALLYAASSVKDVYYLLEEREKRRVRASGAEVTATIAAAVNEYAWGCVLSMGEMATVVPVDQSDLWIATKFRTVHEDLEDDLVLAAMERSQADFLVTSDETLLRKSPVAALSPHDLLALMTA